jgi:outer membrane protein OmpA-like peptidoglycan-associated protein
VTNWASGLLKLEGNGNHYAVKHMLSPTLVAAMGLRPFGLELEFGLNAPFRVMSGDRGPDSDGGTPDDPNDDHSFQFDGQGIGDLNLQLKWRVLDTSRHAFGLALIAGLGLPTTSARARWLGDDQLTPQLRLAMDRSFGRLSVAANAAFRAPLAKTTFVDNQPPMVGGVPAPMTQASIVSSASLPFGLGAAYALSEGKFDVVGELYGAVPTDQDAPMPIEALVALKMYLAKNSFLSLGVGRGLLRERAGNPNARAFVGIIFEPNVGDRDADGKKDDVDRCPDEPEDYDDFEDEDGCPEPDNDFDSILDIDDLCPLEPEDRDGDEDEDGCPENSDHDRDGDRIIDREDQCPDDPEDYDGFQDKDGCPDPDNDKDGILDIDDLCPEKPEDHDGFDDRDGCPDPDNDGDRILDADDQCPRVDGESADETKETYNTVDDEDGCPDRGIVVETDVGIEILDKIHFEYDSAKIKKVSHGILDAVAMTILTNPDIARIEVQGHTDERGSAVYNKLLSERRAKSVMDYLHRKGVPSSRLQSHGYGEEVPKNKKHNEAAWAENRRVEFIILERHGE